MQRTVFLQTSSSAAGEAQPEQASSTGYPLTKRVADVDAYLRDVRGKALKAQFKRLMRAMIEGDELWEWLWSDQVGVRFCYAYGWCVVRNGQVIAEELIHTS